MKSYIYSLWLLLSVMSSNLSASVPAQEPHAPSITIPATQASRKAIIPGRTYAAEVASAGGKLALQGSAYLTFTLADGIYKGTTQGIGQGFGADIGKALAERTIDNVSFLQSESYQNDRKLAEEAKRIKITTDRITQRNEQLSHAAQIFKMTRLAYNDHIATRDTELKETKNNTKKAACEAKWKKQLSVDRKFLDKALDQENKMIAIIQKEFDNEIEDALQKLDLDLDIDEANENGETGEKGAPAN